MSALIELTQFTVTRDDQLCSGGREPIPAGAAAYEDKDGWVVCELHSTAWAAGTEDGSSGNPYDQWSVTLGGWDGDTDELAAEPEGDAARCASCGHMPGCSCPHHCAPAED
jgi:hypothetical protein